MFSKLIFDLMCLRPGAYFKAGAKSIRSQESRAPTEESVNQVDSNPLTTIHEEEYSSTSSESFSYVITEMPARSVHSGNLGAGPSNLFSESNSIELILKYVNAHVAHIYQDENGNYYYKVGDVATPAPERVEVFYNADLLC